MVVLEMKISRKVRMGRKVGMKRVDR